MKPSPLAAFALLVLLAAASALPAHAQVPEPTPTPNPMVYTDMGMEFTAPPGAVPLGQRQLNPLTLPEDLTPVALWAVKPGTNDMRLIQIQMEQFQNPPYQWEAQFESQMHNSGGSGVLIKGKTPMALQNGMPATFVEITSGNGFDAKKEYAIVWADGTRGIALSVTAKVGVSSAEEAKEYLKNASAVRFPVDRVTPPPQPYR